MKKKTTTWIYLHKIQQILKRFAVNIKRAQISFFKSVTYLFLFFSEDTITQGGICFTK